MSKPPPISGRSEISPFIVMDVMRAANEQAAAGGDVCHMEVGQPATPAPARVIAAAHAALDTERLGYAEALGIPELRERIAEHYRLTYGCDVSPERVVVTTGSSGGFLLAFLAAFEQGTRLALAEPGYPAYRNILKVLGIEPVFLEVKSETRFQPTAELVEEAARAGALHGLLIASPSNPTGTMIPEDELARLAQLCLSRGLWFISDEIYHGITYDQPADTVLNHSPDAIVVNSFSKYFSMTGWRIGWMVVPERLVRVVERLAQNLFISAPTLSQRAALAAFDATEELDGNVAAYARNRALLLAELPKAGFHDLAPVDGAFYIYADVRHLTNDSEKFCRKMLDEIGVATTPGTDFDTKRGHGYIRFSFAGSEDDMAEAARRMQSWLKR